jgi:outer membrane biosynthesis protein TonB
MARRLLHLALLALLSLALAGCGGAENERMLPSEDADALLAHLDAAEEFVEEDRCGRARSQLRQAAARTDQLDQQVSDELRRNIADWIAYLRAELPEVCEPEPEETPTPAPTPATPTPATPTPAPTPTPTPEPTPSPTPTPTPDDDDDDEDDEDDNGGGGGGTGGSPGGSGNTGGTGGTPPVGGSG